MAEQLAAERGVEDVEGGDVGVRRQHIQAHDLFQPQAHTVQNAVGEADIQLPHALTVEQPLATWTCLFAGTS